MATEMRALVSPTDGRLRHSYSGIYRVQSFSLTAVIFLSDRIFAHD
jgi:hypothetical protein